MFENILHQEHAAAALSTAIQRSSLPRSLLFSGPAGSGKTSAALELARVLSCSAAAEWNCPCPSCERHRRLLHPDLMLLGPDAFGPEIAASLGMMERSQSKRELYAFLRSIRRLSKRFDPDLWTGEESKFSKASPILLSLEEIMSDLDPGSPKADPLQAAKRAAEEAAKLIALVPQSVPIFQVRNAATWSRLSPSGKRKCLVIENADSMLDSARNALLKLLEEPPESLTIVLTSPRKSALIETVLSRLRDVPFRERSRAETADVLARIFALPSPPDAGSSYESVSAFLESFSAFPEEASRKAARGFISAALERAASRGAALSRAAESLRADPADKLPQAALERDGFQAFLRSLASELPILLRSGDPDDLKLAEAWTALIRDFSIRASTYNQNPESLARCLLSEMEERA